MCVFVFDTQVTGRAVTSKSFFNVSLMSREGGVVAHCNGTLYPSSIPGDPAGSGEFEVSSPNLWWPWTMSDNPGYLYVFQVSLTSSPSSFGVSDIYRQPIGIRTVFVTFEQFLINNKKFYFQGFGKHEDFDVSSGNLSVKMWALLS